MVLQSYHFKRDLSPGLCHYCQARPSLKVPKELVYFLCGGVGFCGETLRRMFWKTSTPWCIRCGYGCLVSNRRNSELLLSSQTKCNYKHNSRDLCTILFPACTFLPVLLSSIIIIMTLNNTTAPFQSEPNL